MSGHRESLLDRIDLEARCSQAVRQVIGVVPMVDQCSFGASSSGPFNSFTVANLKGEQQGCRRSQDPPELDPDRAELVRRGVDDRVPTHRSGEVLVVDWQSGQGADFELDVWMSRLCGGDHSRSDVEASDLDRPSREVRRRTTRPAADVRHGAATDERNKVIQCGQFGGAVDRDRQLGPDRIDVAVSGFAVDGTGFCCVRRNVRIVHGSDCRTPSE